VGISALRAEDNNPSDSNIAQELIYPKIENWIKTVNLISGIVTNNEHQTTNNKQRTTNNEQQTTNNEQQTTNNW
jgi:hypothetical protein